MTIKARLQHPEVKCAKTELEELKHLLRMNLMCILAYNYLSMLKKRESDAEPRL